MAEKPVAELEQLLEQFPEILWHHCPDSRGCHGSPGMPDFVVVAPRGVAFREAKPPGQHPRGGQVEWKYRLAGNGLSWALWTQRDLDNGLVRAELEQLLGVAHEEE